MGLPDGHVDAHRLNVAKDKAALYALFMLPAIFRRSRWTPTRTVILVLALAVTPGLMMGALLSSAFMFPEPGRPSERPETVGLSSKAVSLTSRDGVKLVGWDIRGSSTARVVLVVHGSSASSTTHLAEAKILHDAGFTVVMANLRRHGGSGSAMKTFGLNEAQDVRAFVEYACTAYPGCRLGVYGASMGAVASLLEAREDGRVLAVIADSGFASFVDLVRHRLHEGFGPALGDYIAPFALVSCCILARALPYEWNAADAAGACKSRPLLIIHGSRDTFMPQSAPFDIKAAVPAAALWIVPGAEHSQTRLGRDAEYAARIVDFYGRALGQDLR